VQDAAADLLGVTVEVPTPAEYVALGAARQAAWVISGVSTPPEWPRSLERTIEPADDRAWAITVRDRYARAVRTIYLP
jgi:xylulokinase